MFQNSELFPLHFELEASVFQVFRQVEIVWALLNPTIRDLSLRLEIWEKTGGFQPV
jgi:hypothetical protein